MSHTNNFMDFSAKQNCKKRRKPTITKQLNANNVLITRDFINKLFQKFGVNQPIKNLQLYQQAFVHKSYVKGPEDEATAPSTVVPFQEQSYERLEYIGDAILNAIIADYVFHRYEHELEGFLTTLRTKLVRSKTLARLGRKLKLGRYIIMSKDFEDKCNGRKTQNLLEDIFEALIGALFLDFGSENEAWCICKVFITTVFEKYVDIVTMVNREDNYKKILLELYQKKYHTEPKYQIICMRGPTNRRMYTMAALSPSGEIIGIGEARKKIDAEQSASKRALQYYGEEVEVSETDSLSSCSTDSE